ncbi:MAG: helix-turn-helix domain-containing protein [Lachnospiraceae bacterium]
MSKRITIERHVYHINEFVVERIDNGHISTYQLITDGVCSNMIVNHVLPGLNAMFYEFNSPYCYVFNDMAIVRDIVKDVHSRHHMLEINYCREGGFTSNHRDIVRIQEGDIALAETIVTNSRRGFINLDADDWRIDLPTSYYRGFGLVIDLDLLQSESSAFLEYAELDIEELMDLFHLEHKEFILSTQSKIERVISEIYQYSQADFGMFRLKILEFLLLLKTCEIPKHSLKRPRYSLENIKIIKQVHTLLTSNLDTKYTIEELARLYGISSTALKKTFREIYDDPLATYMKKYRLEKAEKTLLETDTNIGKIAEQVGYESAGKFSSAFKKEFGCSPFEYRTRRKQNDS